MNDQNKKYEQRDQLKRRYARLTQRLAKLGPVLQGTITERTIERAHPQDPKKTKTYGPYYQWTFKRHGKTVTINLTRQQAKRYQSAIDNQRILDEIAEQMRELSLKILETTTTGVSKRKTRADA